MGLVSTKKLKITVELQKINDLAEIFDCIGYVCNSDTFATVQATINVLLNGCRVSTSKKIITTMFYYLPYCLLSLIHGLAKYRRDFVKIGERALPTLCVMFWPFRQHSYLLTSYYKSSGGYVLQFIENPL